MTIEKFILCLDDDTKYEFYSEYELHLLSDLCNSCKYDEFIIFNSAKPCFSNTGPRDMMVKVQNIKYIQGAEQEILHI